MSAPALVQPIATTGWPLWLSQTGTIVRAELRRNFVKARGFWIYLLALAPAVVIWMHTIVEMLTQRNSHSVNTDTQILATIFQVFFLRPAVFFGCFGIFSQLFQGEVLERSLHYYFLAPVRREVLLIGKFIAGVITSTFFFGGSIALCFVGMYAHFPSSDIEFFLSSGGVGHLLAYLAITALACLAYGALFLWLGIRYRNPVIPAVVLLFVESLNLFLPSWLAKFSILYYLRSLTPVDPNLTGAGAILGAVADSASVWVAVPALLAITSVLLVLAARQLKKTEVSYSSD